MIREQFQDLLKMVQSACQHSARTGNPICVPPQHIWCGEFLIASEEKIWAITVSDYTHSISEVPNPMLKEVLRSAMATNEGRVKLVEAGIAFAKEHPEPLSVWQRLG